MADVMSYCNCFRKLMVESKVFCYCCAYTCNMVYVFDPGADVVILWSVENLRFVLQPSVGFAVKDAGIVPFKFRAYSVPVIKRTFTLDAVLPFWIVLVTPYIYKGIFHKYIIVCSL